MMGKDCQELLPCGVWAHGIVRHPSRRWCGLNCSQLSHMAAVKSHDTENVVYPSSNHMDINFGQLVDLCEVADRNLQHTRSKKWMQLSFSSWMAL